MLQEKLKALGFSPGNIDEPFGGGTEAAVIAISPDRDSIHPAQCAF
jgi:peptidoglycan hydrolase-like protein with peptidoglycan-binding domain